MMNLKGGGSHGKLSDEFKRKLKASSINKNKGAIISEETRKKISLAKKGKPLSEAHKEKIRSLKIGIKASDETKKKMSDMSARGYKWKVSGGKQWKARIVYDTATNSMYDSIAKAASVFGLKRRTLEAMLSGQNKNKTTLTL